MTINNYKNQYYQLFQTGCDLIPAPSLLMEQRGLASKKKDDKRTIALFPVITRKEFKFKTLDPDSKVNPFDTVLKGGQLYWLCTYHILLSFI